MVLIPRALGSAYFRCVFFQFQLGTTFKMDTKHSSVKWSFSWNICNDKQHASAFRKVSCPGWNFHTCLWCITWSCKSPFESIWAQEKVEIQWKQAQCRWTTPQSLRNKSERRSRGSRYFLPRFWRLVFRETSIMIHVRTCNISMSTKSSKNIMPFSNLRDPIHVQHDWWFQSQLKFML